MAVNFNNQPYSYPLNPYPIQPTYNQQANFAQPFQQAPIQSSTNPRINGRIVNSQNDISPGEVIMDGSVSIFPLSDGSAIYTKKWQSDGTISTTKYIPDSVIDAEIIPANNEDFFDSVNLRLDKIESLLKQRQYHRKKTNHESKRSSGKSYKSQSENC